MASYLIRPRSFTVQWHITERCNWKCKHCYQEENYVKEELTLSQLIAVLDQYAFLLKTWNIPGNRAQLNISGGEPFMRKDFFQFLEAVHERSHFFRWALLSNGSFVTKDAAKKLKAYGIDGYQVSLEGLEEYNDEIRGKGTFKQVLRAIKILTEEGIHTNVSLTLTKKNMQEIPELCEILYQSGAVRINTRRLIPIGSGCQLADELLEPHALREYYLKTLEMNREFRKQRRRFNIYIGCESSVFNDEAPEFRKYECAVYHGRLLVLMPNGDVLPCRRLPIKVGNVMQQSLFEIWYSSNKLWEMRNLNNAHPFCQSCSNFNQCFGGAKCVTYAHFNKLFVPDVQCWKFYRKLEQPDSFVGYEEEIKKEQKHTPLLYVPRSEGGPSGEKGWSKGFCPVEPEVDFGQQCEVAMVK